MDNKCDVQIISRKSELGEKKKYFETAHFKYSWRSYQKRILDNLNYHMDDNALHIVAPPGSGKTILGLEVAVRLNKPTLILAPTLAIRDQWVTKFRDLFLAPNNSMEWITTDIHHPKYLTIVTYQALHAVATNTKVIEVESTEEEEADDEETNLPAAQTSYTDQLIKSLEDVHIGTIILDEAHHLKKEWWKTLFAIKTSIKAKIVALTATPPYDVSPTEWDKYVQLSGEVDEEIFITELVREGDICPHQDLIYLSQPTDEELLVIHSQKEKLTADFNALLEDPVLLEAFYNHPFHQTPLKYIKEILDNINYYYAICIYLKERNQILKENFINPYYSRYIDNRPFDYSWAEILLNGYLKGSDDYLTKYKEHRRNLYNHLKEDGFIENGVVSFTDLSWLNKRLSSSLSKLESIQEIVAREYKSMNQDLRMVILTDYVRKEFLNANPNNKIDKIGVVPIFEYLRRKIQDPIKMGVLTGSIVIIPASSISRMDRLSQNFHEKKELSISYEPLTFAEEYVIVSLSSDKKNKLVEFTTQLFEEGEIELLIGTKSLLGEGWDAPSINSLLLATFVGSYVLSNQMRGRAIRSSNSNPHKASNIWHLACASDMLTHGGNDIRLLRKRFRSFVGLTNTSPHYIEKGIKRLMLPSQFDAQSMKEYNDFSFHLSDEQSTLNEKWDEALKNGSDFMEFVHIPHPLSKSKYTDQITEIEKKKKNSLTKTGVSLLVISTIMLIPGPFNKLACISIPLAYTLFNAYKSLSSYIKEQKYNISRHIKSIAMALVQTMQEENMITHSDIKIEVLKKDDGSVNCHLIGASYAEEKLFTKMFVELFEPINNPRYMIKRITENEPVNKLPQKKDEQELEFDFKNKIYFAVPEMLGLNKISANRFATNWEEYLGKCELIYLKNQNGHKELLNAKTLALEEHKDDEEEDTIIERWSN